MTSSEIRQNLCEFCILVKGSFKEAEVSEEDVKRCFQGCKSAALVARTANFEPSEREWILQFPVKNDKDRYLEKPVSCDLGDLVTGPCDLPCDIPEEWLSDLPSENDQAEEDQYEKDRYSPDTWSYSNAGSHSEDGPNVSLDEANSKHAVQSDSYTHTGQSSQHQGQPGYPEEVKEPQPNTGPPSVKGPWPNPYAGPFYPNPNQPMFYPGYQMPWLQNASDTSGQGPQGRYWQGQGYPPGYYPLHPYQGYGLGPPPAYNNPVNPDEHQGDETKAGSTCDKKNYMDIEDTEKHTTEGRVSPEPRKEENDSDDQDQVEPMMEEENSVTFENEDESKLPPRANKMKVTNLPEGTSEENLTNFFENTRRYGGGYIEDVQLIEHTTTAIITFEEDEAVERVLKKVPISYQGVILHVEHYTEPDEDDEEPMLGDESYQENENKPVPPANRLIVTNLPEGTSEENLINFFENTRRYGGGDIEDVELDEDTSTAIITFKEDDAVERVLKKVPISFQGKILTVEAYTESGDLQDDSFEGFHTPSESDSESEPSHTIEVTGMAEDASRDSILYYFESRKGGDVDVAEMEYVEKRKMYLVTFESEEGVNNSLKKNHKVEKSNLSVRRHIPPKKYPNKTLIKGLPENVSEELLWNYIEARTKIDVETVELSEEDPDKAIVTFTTNIDIEKIQKYLKKPLQGSHLTAHRVAVSDCIIVKGFSDSTTRTTLECYFDNKRKSGVEGVTECEMNEEEGYCLVYFEQATDAVKAARRKHTVEKCQLQVNIYHECLGVCTSDQEGGTRFKPLQPIIVKNISIEKMKFMQVSISGKEDIESVLMDAYGKVDWQASNETDIKIESTITKETKNWSIIIRNWEKDIRGKVDDYIRSIVLEEVSILQDAWKEAMTKIREINVSDPDKVTINVEKPPNCKFVIVGFQDPVQEVVQKVKGIFDEVVKDLEMKKQQVNEDITVKHHQALILELTKFPDKIKQRFSDLDVKINGKDCIVNFTGSAGSVTEAKIEMYQLTSDIVQGSLGQRSNEFLKFLELREVKRIVGRKMRDASCIGVWGVQIDIVTMYSTTTHDLTRASDIFKDSVVETQIETEKNQKHLLQSQKWNLEKKSIEDEYNHKSICTKIVVEKQGKITLFCTSTAEMANIRERVSNFFFINAENEIVLDIGLAELSFLHENMKNDIAKLEKELRLKNIFVAFKSDCVVAKGNQAGIQEAKTRVDSLVKLIHKSIHSVNKPGISELMRTDRGKNKLKQIGKSNGVVICMEDELKTGGGNKRVEYTAAGGQKVIVVKEDITALNVDVIVNAANKDLAHSGGLAKVIINKGGSSIQDECYKYTKKHGQLKEGSIFCSGPGTLKCTFIIHAVGPVWQNGQNWEEKHLSDCVESSLAEADKKRCSSIAFPALCTGIFAYPAGEATRVIVESVRDYFKSNTYSNIQTVYLCDILSSTVDLFMKAGNKFLSQGQGQSLSQRPSSGGRRGERFIAGPPKGKEVHVPAPKLSTGNIKVKVIKGELAKMKVDVIVNTTSRDLRLGTGAVSKSLLIHGGQALQDECLHGYPNGIDYGEVAVTSGGKLNCLMVCHGSLDMWQHGGSSIKTLEQFMTGCLNAANMNGMKTIAFPAMGTGNLGYPKDLVAQSMFKAVASYGDQNPKTKITDVLFVVYDKDYETVKAFEDQERNFNKGTFSQPFGTPTSFPGKPQLSSDSDKLYSVDLGNVTLKIYKGDITQAKVDVIVNSSNSDLDLTLGAVSKAILQKGGPELKKQIDRQRRAMRTDGMAVTKVGSGMPCSVVIHLDMKETSRKLKEKITQALTKTDEIMMSSLAFPALGTSTGYTVQEAAEDLYNAVDKFQSKSPQNVKEVHVVIFQTDMVKTFMDTIQKCCSKQKGIWGKFVGYLGFGSNDDQKITAEDRSSVLNWSSASSDTSPSVPVKFFIFARNQREAKMAVTILEAELDKEFITKFLSDRMIKEFSPEQISLLKRICSSEKVEMNINKTKGEITFKGIKENVFNAWSKTNDIISSAQQQRFNTQKSQLLNDVVQWWFIDVNKGKKSLNEFPPEVNLIIENGFRDMKSKVEFHDQQGNTYVVDLDENKMYPEKAKWDVCDIFRRPKLAGSSFTPPSYWDSMDDTETLKRVILKSSSKEYKDLIKEFEKTGGPGFTIVKVERIQNKTLYQQYLAKKKQMDDTNPPGHQNERKLWHGTDQGAEDSITRYGFNRSYCGKHATAYGAGVYFAVSAGYSISDTYSRPDAKGHKRMYYCRVLTGESARGNSAMRVPPSKKQGTHLLYDTTTDNPLGPSMFIIYHDSQAVADYLITFKR